MPQPATNPAAAANGPAPFDFSDLGGTPISSPAKAAPKAQAKPALDFSDFGATPIATPPKGTPIDFSEFGAVPVATKTAPKAPVLPPFYGFLPRNLAANAWEGAKSTVKGAYQLGKDLLSNPNWVDGDNSTLHKFVEAPMQQQADEAVADYRQPGIIAKISSAGHALASGLPLVGPWAASIGEQAGTGDVGGAMAKGAAQVATPMLVTRALNATKTLASPLLKAGAERMYQSALKPSTAKFAPDPASVVRTGLENSIPVSEGGADKLDNLLDDTNQRITDTIASAPAKTISKGLVLQRLNPLVGRFSNQVNPASDLSAIADAGKEFADTQPGDIPATDAQALKQGTYAQLKGRAYGELKGATVESQKALARGLKEELANAFPELNELNAKDSALIDLNGALEKAVQRGGNHDLIGLGTSVAGAAGGAIRGGPGMAVAAALKYAIDNPVVKSKLAIALNKAAMSKYSIPNVSARIGAYSAGLANAGNAQQKANASSAAGSGPSH